MSLSIKHATANREACRLAPIRRHYKASAWQTPHFKTTTLEQSSLTKFNDGGIQLEDDQY